MQELPSFIPPGGLRDDMGHLTFDPNGPVGRLVDSSYERRMTLGELAQQREPPPFGFGWVLDYSQGTAIPYWGIPGQTPYSPSPFDFLAMQAAAMAAQASTAQANNGYTNAELLLLLLS